MMNLLERIDALKVQVQELKTAQLNVGESQRLQTRLEEVDLVAIPLAQQVTLLNIFRTEGIDLSGASDTVEKAVKRIQTIQERFKAESKAASLTKGQDWTLMKKYTSEVTASVKTNLTDNWNRFVESSYSGEKPQNLQRSLAQTESNESALSRYRVEYDNLNLLARKLPESSINFENVRSTASKLKDIYKEFDFNVPEIVKEFLKAVGSGGADLDLLTDEVSKWLHSNGTINRYQIVARR